MKKQNLILIISCLLLLSSCAWLDESELDKIDGTFYCGWNDLQSNRDISRKIKGSDGQYEGIISCYVYATGHRGKFIIAKQHLNFSSETNYYILDTLKYNENRKGLYGPMNVSEFNKLRNTLEISDIVFSKTYKEKP